MNLCNHESDFGAFANGRIVGDAQLIFRITDEHTHFGGAHVVGRIDVVDAERDHFTFELFRRRRDILSIVDFCLVLDVDTRSTNHHFRCRCAKIGDGLRFGFCMHEFRQTHAVIVPVVDDFVSERNDGQDAAS